jgi:hypothetical protein
MKLKKKADDTIVRQEKTVTGRFGDYSWLLSIPAYSPFIYCKAEITIY